MKKKDSTLIRKIDGAIGTVTRKTWEKVPITGQELLLTGYGKGEKSSRILPDKTYYMTIPVLHYHSSKKELKRILKREGMEGIKGFVTKIHDQIVKNDEH